MSTPHAFRQLAVIGAGNMGSGIAQKMATEGFQVILVDLDDEKVARGIGIIEKTLAEGVERRIFKPEQAEKIRERVRGSADWQQLAACDLIVEAVFEDESVKQQVFKRLDEVCRPDAILATNTSSFSVTDLAGATKHPERVLGLHYFYHPAKNRLVEVVPGKATDPAHTAAAWSLQEQLGKTPIASADANGFVVNRFFVPWLNEAVRLLAEEVADIATIEAACKKSFGVGMGPFELMNVTGVPIALHAATTLGQAFGPIYAPDERLAKQVASGDPWPLDGEPDESRFDTVAERMQAVTFYIATALVDEGVGSVEDTDIGARVGLRWPRGPFQMMNRVGVEGAAQAVRKLAERWELTVPKLLADQAAKGERFSFELVKSSVDNGIATLTINRPDAMNALNEAVVGQLHAALRAARDDDRVRGIILAGAGKAFIAGADIRFFVRNIEAKKIDRIVEFTEAGHALLADIESCPKPVVARMHGTTLGGGLELALACSAIVATPKAVMAFPETGIGIYPGLGGTQRTPRRVGSEIAKWLIYTGEFVPGEIAYQIGLVNEIVSPAKLDGACRRQVEAGRPLGSATWPVAYAEIAKFFATNRIEEIRTGHCDTGGNKTLFKAAQKIASKAPVALRIAEKLIDEGGSVSLEEGLKMELAHLPEIFATADAYEGLSTLGRKKPEFKGR